MVDMTDRERFLAMLSTQPMLHYSDAAVVLCGEDARPRVNVGMELLTQTMVACVVLSGGRDELPRWQGAERIRTALIQDRGVDPRLLLTDPASMNTHEQAVNVVAMAREHDWTRLVLVASAYHQYRAFLTFVRELRRQKLERRILVVSRPATVAPWYGTPAGCDVRRIALLEEEFGKMRKYARLRHVSTYKDGMLYLREWEGLEA
jgi:uncharacterized SAM-binding protein YcdF (DUF218 family)